MSCPVHLLGICGSLRKQSYNRSLLRLAGSALPVAVTIRTHDLSAVPFYSGDLESEGLPESVRELRELIARADALLIATPEYNFSIPGVLKNTIDWVSRPPDQPFDGKPVALIGGGGGLGTWGSQSHLRYVLTALGAHVLSRPWVTIANVWDKISPEGVCGDQQIEESVAQLVQALVDWTRRLRPPAN